MNKKRVIGIIAPSSPVPDGLVKEAVIYFENLDYSVRLGKNIDKVELMAAGSDQKRAADLMDFFKDPDVSIIVTTNGGTCSIRTLPLLDYDLIRKNPKPIVGYSDATALQVGIYAQTGMTTLTGFNCTDIKMGKVAEKTWDTLVKCLNQQNYTINSGVTVQPGMAAGPLIGGNLTCLLNLMGTPYEPDFNGKILLIEDVGIEPYLIEGMFSQLYIAGIMEKVAGIIIGQFTECTAKHYDSKGISTEDIIDFWCKRIKVPCIKDFLYGHVENKAVLPIGQLVTLDASNAKLEIDFSEKAVRCK